MWHFKLINMIFMLNISFVDVCLKGGAHGSAVFFQRGNVQDLRKP